MKIQFFLLLLFPLALFGSKPVKEKPATPKEVINLIKKQVTCVWDDKTVDTFKAGNPDSPLKGVATCMFCDMYVLKEAVRQNCNLIITHEPTFYNHTDDVSFLKDNKVYQGKKKFIEDNGLVIWRFHDHWHKTVPDGINFGMNRKLGWENFRVDHSFPLFILPETTLSKLSNEVMNKLNINNIRIIGDPNLRITRAAFLAGAPGSRPQMEALNSDDVDVLIGGEVPEWETYLNAKDAVALGMKKGVIFLGHTKSEEDGMAYCAEWLKSFTGGVPVVFIKNQPNFRVKKINKF